MKVRDFQALNLPPDAEIILLDGGGNPHEIGEVSGADDPWNAGHKWPDKQDKFVIIRRGRHISLEDE